MLGNMAAGGLAAAESAALNANVLPYGPYSPALAYEEARIIGPGLTYGLSLSDLVASNGCGLRVSSSSPISPNGVKVQSDNMAIEGPLAISGQLPFLGVVGLEGPLPAAGQGAVAYGVGNGNIGMVSEGGEGIANNVASSLGNPGIYGAGLNGLAGYGMQAGYGMAPFGGPGCGGAY
ncbi:unnamed protein product [Leptidea sinapis]|uniref:Chorion class B protein Ld34 n=1 Tax=Leptidea sinapis TaxID=189913 RepID=A0A5E4PZI6_9NEOP|nr:unnamed protein product [Leptidea sinapis]